ncbi:MAG: vWA domain-containing protein [Pseudomonadota bacterium]
MTHLPQLLKRTLPALCTVAFLSACVAPDGSAIIVADVASEAAPTARDKAERSSPTRSKRGVSRAGVLTAGDIDDSLNFTAFQRYAQRAAQQTGLARSALTGPVRVKLSRRDVPRRKVGYPPMRLHPGAGIRYTLRVPGAAEPFFSGFSGVDGNITVFPQFLGAKVGQKVELRAFGSDGQLLKTTEVTRGAARQEIMVGRTKPWEPDFLDLVFVIDTTGSMADELAWVTKDLRRMVGQARRAAPGIDIRLGLVVYRDKGDAYVVRSFGFAGKPGPMKRLLSQQKAAGGGDYPEASDAALASAVALPWRRGRGVRLIFHIADAPAHKRNADRYLAAAKTAARKGIQVFGIGASGVGPEAEYLMRQVALMTGGRYVFLTDDSGVGNSHAEPTVSCYRVTRLTDLIGRILASEVSGLRKEAKAGHVLRQVGSYARGVCAN